MGKHTHLADNIIEIYNNKAYAWTALRGSCLYEKVWLDRFLKLLPQHSNILDLGCGSGQPIAAYLIEQSHNVTGVDSSEEMLDMARENFPEDLFPNCTWIQADMRTVELIEKFQGILAWDSFFHLSPEWQRAMFQRFDRFATQGTVLMFTSGPTFGEQIGDLFGEPLYHASLSSEEYIQLFHNYGFKVINRVVEDPNCTGHTVWLVQRK
ncbi:class I SAM-dependent methyltransferase [Acinetobacter bereziniae]|jgi:ubiquinone/menaquinone biosynthesis C-methylase UbiE|uniref:class I SAM-dependent methyltransferase n=1 Tax=Acinetobacter bereziniae TaxID=106648 RepID=UPI00125F91A3|nr:class I SAM-dependent methyltransferase [Acinetobacter bereziniae]MDM1783314.1 class I SAM-dependent methyltransferase [Acinetobacter bereziniae]